MLFTHPTPQWQRALERSDAGLIRVRRVLGGSTTHPDHEVWEATSSEEPTQFPYTLGVTKQTTGVEISCDCQAGLHNHPCRHASEVLRVKRLLAPKPQPVRPRVSTPEGRYALAFLNGEDA